MFCYRTLQEEMKNRWRNIRRHVLSTSIHIHSNRSGFPHFARRQFAKETRIEEEKRHGMKMINYINLARHKVFLTQKLQNPSR